MLQPPAASSSLENCSELWDGSSHNSELEMRDAPSFQNLNTNCGYDSEKKPARPSFWSDDRLEDVDEALRRPSNGFQQHVQEIRAAADVVANEELAAANAAAAQQRAKTTLPLGAATLEACGLPHLARRCKQDLCDQRFAVNMVFLLREALGLLCVQLKDAQGYNELLEARCDIYGAQIKQAPQSSKAGVNGATEAPGRPIDPIFFRSVMGSVSMEGAQALLAGLEAGPAQQPGDSTPQRKKTKDDFAAELLSSIQAEKAELSFIFTNLNYDELMVYHKIRDAFIAAIAEGVLAVLPAGYSTRHIEVTLRSGSVVAIIRIIPAAGVSAAQLQYDLNADGKALISSVRSSGLAVRNLADALIGGKSLNDIQVFEVNAHTPMRKDSAPEPVDAPDTPEPPAARAPAQQAPQVHERSASNARPSSAAQNRVSFKPQTDSYQDPEEEQRKLTLDRLKMLGGLDQEASPSKDFSGLPAKTFGDTVEHPQLDKLDASATLNQGTESQDTRKIRLESSANGDKSPAFGAAWVRPEPAQDANARPGIATDDSRTRTVSFHLPSDHEPSESEARSVTSSLPISEMFEPLNQLEVAKLQREFDWVRRKMSDGESLHSGRPSFNGPLEVPVESPGSPDHRVSLHAGRKSMFDFESATAAPPPPASKPESAYKHRRTAISVRGSSGGILLSASAEGLASEGLLSTTPSGESSTFTTEGFYTGRRTAFSIASSRGGDFFAASPKPPTKSRDADNSAKPVASSSENDAPTKPAPRRTRLLVGGFAKGNDAPAPRRLTLFGGGKEAPKP